MSIYMARPSNGDDRTILNNITSMLELHVSHKAGMNFQKVHKLFGRKVKLYIWV